MLRLKADNPGMWFMHCHIEMHHVAGMAMILDNTEGLPPPPEGFPTCGSLGGIKLGSVLDGIYALGKAHMRSTPSLRRFPKVVFEMIPMFVCLTMALSRPFKEDRLALPLSTPLSSRRSVVS